MELFLSFYRNNGWNYTSFGRGVGSMSHLRIARWPLSSQLHKGSPEWRSSGSFWNFKVNICREGPDNTRSLWIQSVMCSNHFWWSIWGDRRCVGHVGLLRLCLHYVLTHKRESRTVLDCGLHTVDSGFQVLDSSICQWNLDSGFQSLVGFRIPWAVVQIPKPRIPDSMSKNFPDCGIRIPLPWAIRRKAFALAQKLHRLGLLFTHNGAMFVTGRSCTALIS